MSVTQRGSRGKQLGSWGLERAATLNKRAARTKGATGGSEALDLRTRSVGIEWVACKSWLAGMLKGGVIMDVTNAEQAQIAERAGACAVMVLERVPSDIRKEGGVARMASIKVTRQIMKAVTIPVMAKVRIGHFAEVDVLQELPSGQPPIAGGRPSKNRT